MIRRLMLIGLGCALVGGGCASGPGVATTTVVQAHEFAAWEVTYAGLLDACKTKKLAKPQCDAIKALHPTLESRILTYTPPESKAKALLDLAIDGARAYGGDPGPLIGDVTTPSAARSLREPEPISMDTIDRHVDAQIQRALKAWDEPR